MHAVQTEFLSAAELHALTAYARGAEQDEWLTKEGIPHKLCGRRVVVSRLHVRAWLEGRPVVSSSGPNWSAVS